MTWDVARKGDWERAIRLLRDPRGRVKTALQTALKAEAAVMAGLMKKGIGRGVAPIQGRSGHGGSRPLAKSGDLRNSITPKQVGALEWFVGIAKNAAGHAGRVYDIARVHEEGRTIIQRMTDKQRRFLFAVVFAGEKRAKGAASPVGHPGIIVIVIPARPFIAPGFAAWVAGGGPTNIVARVAKKLFPA